MNDTITYFNFQAPLYDRYQINCVPRYPEMIATSVDWIRRWGTLPEAPRILDLGCGTGNTTSAVLDAFPGARVTCLDGSEDMLRVAGGKISSSAVVFTHHDLAHDGWSTAWEDGTFDAVVSVLVLEHLPFDAYRSCIRQVARVLKPSAWFVAVEGYAGDFNQSTIRDIMRDLEENAVKQRALTREELEANRAESRERETHYFASIEDKKAWWRESGFVDVDIIWQYYCVAAMVGRKRG
jgi:tRNA (cmo5U34)-methyltransferase